MPPVNPRSTRRISQLVNTTAPASTIGAKVERIGALIVYGAFLFVLFVVLPPVGLTLWTVRKVIDFVRGLPTRLAASAASSATSLPNATVAPTIRTDELLSRYERAITRTVEAAELAPANEIHNERATSTAAKDLTETAESDEARPRAASARESSHSASTSESMKPTARR